MWELYDELISGIPGGPAADEVICGSSWTMVRSGAHAGVAMTMKCDSRPPLRSDFVGVPLRELAQGAKSWNLIEAGVGLAAINTYYNSPEKAAEHGIILQEEPEDRKKQDPFEALQDEFQGKNVCVVGHFPKLERIVAPYCNLSVLERSPLEGDYPDSACEYLLPEQDFVFITGCTLVNKTLPHLLELSKNARVIMVGPSVPMSPVLFRYGVEDLSGFIVTDAALCAQVVGGGVSPIFRAGKIVRLINKKVNYHRLKPMV